MLCQFIDVHLGIPKQCCTKQMSYYPGGPVLCSVDKAMARNTSMLTRFGAVLRVKDEGKEDGWGGGDLCHQSEE